MVFTCPNIHAHYNEAVLCLNSGTPENNEFLEQMEKLLFLGVPILKHISSYIVTLYFVPLTSDILFLTSKLFLLTRLLTPGFL